MRRTRCFGWVLCLSWMLAAEVTFAQQAPSPHAPQISAALISSNELVADLKFLVEHSGPNGARAWLPLKQTLDTFLEGIERTKPIITEVLLSGDGSQLRVHFPITLPGLAFQNNLNGFGIQTKRLAPGFMQLAGTLSGYMRIANAYTSILESAVNPANLRLAQGVLLPAAMKDPSLAIPTLLAKKFDLGLLVKNDKVAAADQAARIKDFQKTKDNLLAGLKLMPDERAERFELRKAFLRHNLEELERFIAETAELTLGWTTDAPQKEARLDLDLTAIAGSKLDASARLLGVAPGMFASVPRSADAMISGRTHFPLDDLRKEHALESIKLARPALEKRIDAEADKTPEWRDSRKLAAKLWFDMLESGTKAGVADGMIEISRAAGQKVNLLLGLKAAKGDDLKPILELLPKIKPELKIQLDVEKVGDLSIHTIQVPDNDEDFDWLFGKGAPVHVATGPNVFWVAVGSKSLEQLKAAIAAAGQGGSEANFFKLFVKAGPAIDLLTERRTRLEAMSDPNKKLTDAEAKAKRDREAFRKLAQEAFKDGKGSWETNIDAKDGKVTGSTKFDEGILKFVGAAIAKFSDENLK